MAHHIIHRATMIGGAWTPADLGADLKRWWDFSDDATVWQDTGATTAAALGDPIGRIDDKSGEGAHLLQATASKRAVRSAAGFNGTVSALFDGVDDELSATGLTDIPAPRTLIVVLQDDGTEGVITRGNGAPGGVSDYAIVNFGSPGTFRFFNGSGHTRTSPHTTSWIAEVEIGPNSGTAEDIIRADNAQSGAAFDSGTAVSGGTWDLCGGYVNRLGGHIAEVLEIGKVLTSERTNLYAYLNAKWGT